MQSTVSVYREALVVKSSLAVFCQSACTLAQTAALWPCRLLSESVSLNSELAVPAQQYAHEFRSMNTSFANKG